MSQVQDDEIDFFDLIQTLWDGKWIISVSVAIAMLIGGSFILLKDASYESKLIYRVDTNPPFYEVNKISIDFQKKFYSVSVFKEWKQNNSNTSLVFEDFSTIELLDGFLLSKNEDEQLATFTSTKRSDPFVLVRSNQLPILDDFFNYAKYVSELLKNDYVTRAKEEIKMIERRFKDLTVSDSNIVNTVLSIDRYIVTSEKGANTLTIQRPTIPKNVLPKTSLILGISVVLGGIVGVFFILIRNAMKKRKEQLLKA